MTPVFRAPMRSRRDDLGPDLAVDRARSVGVCGFGGDDRVRLARRIERFAEIPDGAFVWTHDTDGLYWLGRLTGPYFYDADGEGVDLGHVRPCTWRPQPVPESRVPAAVAVTFTRGGRNFQRIHDDGVGEQSAALWSEAGADQASE